MAAPISVTKSVSRGSMDQLQCSPPAQLRLKASCTSASPMVVTPPCKITGSPVSRIPVPGALPVQDNDVAPLTVRQII